MDDYLLSLALKDAGLSRDDVVIKGMPTDQAAIIPVPFLICSPSAVI